MNRLMKGIVSALALCGAVCSSLPAEAADLTGNQVITMMRNRDDGDDRQGTMTMTLVNRRGSTRVRQLQQVSKDYGFDRRSMITFVDPADVKGTKFLSWTYDELGKDDDKWMYVPSMKKIRRISGAANNDFFMGSDFTYDDIDMGRRNVGKDEHTLLGEEKKGGYDCYRVESVPVDKSDPVKRRIALIDKKTMLVIHLEYYTAKGLSRVYDVLELQEQQGISSVKKAEMNNLLDEHRTIIEFGPYIYNKGMEDSLFQVAVLQRG